MSYYLSAKEAITIKNVNEDTRAFTISVKKYIQDFLQGVRIQSFYNFSMELTVDDKVIFGDYVKGENRQNDVIMLKSNQFNDEGMRKVIENLEFHENISVNLEYSGFFFYFYHYCINRFRGLLDEKLKGEVTYFANEQEEDTLTAYVFTEIDGELMKGYIADHPFEQYKHIKDWEVQNMSFYMELEDGIPWSVYNEALAEAEKLAKDYDLRIYFDPDSTGDSDGSTANPGGIEIDANNSNIIDVSKKIMGVDEIEYYYTRLKKIYDIFKDYSKGIEDYWKMVPIDKKNKEATLLLKVDVQNNLVLRVYDPYAEELYIIPDDSRTSRVSALEEAMSNWEDIQIPMDDSFLE